MIGRKMVTAIGEGAFKGNTSLTRVALPETLRVIGAEAFDGCSAMKRPWLSFGLLEIGDRAFNGVSGYALTLPRTLIFIGEDAFTGYGYLNAYVGSYTEQWALPLAAQDSSLMYTGMYIARISVSTNVALPGEEVTCTALRIEDEVTSVQWQRSFDGINWTNCEGEGADTQEYSLRAVFQGRLKGFLAIRTKSAIIDMGNKNAGGCRTG